ncbi:hypothetical protein BR93DRAFT_627710 [Coniochaeta sp. PMI_546]|nr:hypothetical protein BR93DRAFT_627710 [Coniochaeta sp. PMI_546]
MQIGDKEYLVHIKNIPYLQAMVVFQQNSGQLTDGQTPVHEDDIPFFEIINFAVSHGFRHFFRFMPDNLDRYRELFKTLDYLLIDVLEQIELHDIAKEIEEGVTAWIKFTRAHDYQAVQQLVASEGDTAFRLLYMIVMGKIEGEFRSGHAWYEEDRANPAFRPMRAVMLNVRLWDQGTKMMLLRAYYERFGVSYELQMCYDFCIRSWKQLME